MNTKNLKDKKKTNMIKLIVSDIDETLVDNRKNVPKRNIEAIEKAQDLGKIVMLATGRGPYELRDIPEQAGVVHDDRYIICCNGAVIITAKDRKIVDSSPLKFKYAKAVFDYCYENSQQCFIYTLDKKYAINLDPIEYSHEIERDSNIVIVDDGDIDFLEEEFILKALIKNTDMDYLHALEVDIARITDYDVEIAYSSDMYMEINAKGVDKGIALAKVCNHYEIKIDDSMAIGDNYNDVAMLEASGLSVAVENAHLQVKEVADYVTKASHNEGAVGEAIEKFVLNQKEA